MNFVSGKSLKVKIWMDLGLSWLWDYESINLSVLKICLLAGTGVVIMWQKTDYFSLSVPVLQRCLTRKIQWSKMMTDKFHHLFSRSLSFTAKENVVFISILTNRQKIKIVAHSQQWQMWYAGHWCSDKCDILIMAKWGI